MVNQHYPIPGGGTSGDDAFATDDYNNGA